MTAPQKPKERLEQIKSQIYAMAFEDKEWLISRVETLETTLKGIAESVPNREVTESLRAIAWAHWMRDEALDALKGET